MHYVYEYSLSHKKMQLSEILLEYVKTKCDDLNLFVGIAIVQIYIYIYISFPCLRPGATTVLCSGALPGVAVSRSASELVSTATTFTTRARLAPVVSLVATGAAPLRRPGGLSERSTWTNLEKVQHLVIIFLLIGGDWNHGILWLSIFFE